MVDLEEQPSVNLLDGVPRRRKSLKQDENIILKGLYVERSVAEDLRDFARVLDLEESRLANAILKLAFSERTTIQEIRAAIPKIRAIRGIYSNQIG